MIGVVVLNFNGWRDTVACLQSLLPAVDASVRIVVVDNASTDESVEAITEWGQQSGVGFCVVAENVPDDLPAIALMPARVNGGFAAGNNLGIELLRRRGDVDLYWVLNNDTEVDPGALDALRRFALAHPEMGMIGSTIAEFDQRDVVQCAGGAYYDAWLTLNRAGHHGKPISAMAAAPTPRMNYVCGAAMLIRREVVDAIGLLNEDYFLYYEEIDFARRAREHGFQLGWCRDAIVYHKGGATTGGNRRATPRKSALAEYHANLSCLKYTRRFERSAFAVSSMTRFVLKAGHHVVAKQWHLLPALLDAYVDYFRGTSRR